MSITISPEIIGKIHDGQVSTTHAITLTGEQVSIDLQSEPFVWNNHQTMELALVNQTRIDPAFILATIINMHLQPDPEKRGLFTEHHISIRARDPIILGSITSQIWESKAETASLVMEPILLIDGLEVIQPLEAIIPDPLD
ncbi:MAG: hypothetical protein US52_C0002G0013 [candidate division WS6 bacterium GW2011_GWA2_37_6]|uniref:Uncharacterized protein n=1 Tax=candidate division WS6 bacterium GW2011_GWA2_37_6 TaxID=1619087 RepID=A0A0G0HCQ5_9BACT|nr:MAG: hypothetical protein US52_C0002G0013 [candidate division WS6 bacterium GW2011_GWA2_37_6]